MVFKIFRTFWPSQSSKKGPDLIDKIEALERQLRSYADDAQAGEETLLFGDISDQNYSTASNPIQNQTGRDSRNAPDYEGDSTEDELSRFEYSRKPIRIAVQLFRDLVLFLVIGIVWLLDRWYRCLFIALPTGLYITAYRFITREDVASADVVVSYFFTFLILLGLIMLVWAVEMGNSRRTSLLSNR